MPNGCTRKKDRLMNRLSSTLQSLKAEKKKALACFLTAGFPTLDATVPYAQEIAGHGADILELGMPFSDPLADGPVIQSSSQIALQQGISLEIILSMVSSIRQESNIPIVLMGYLNPILRYGTENFFQDAAERGVDGVILPELPYEESGRYRARLAKLNIANILLVTPTTSQKRIRMIDEASNGFLYCVSTTGVTGSGNVNGNAAYLRDVQKLAKKNPVLVGFGIKSPDDARRTAQYADGVIVGSALIKKISEGESGKQIGSWVRELKSAMNSSS